MIEQTDEMLRALLGKPAHRALEAVLEIIERDYRITCPARYELERGTTHCVKAPRHPGGHRGEHPSAGVFWL